MGFGLLLVGYFTATVMSLNLCGGVYALIGYVISIFAAKKLSQYNRSFVYLLWASVVMAMFSSVIAFYDVTALLYRYLIIPFQPISDIAGENLLTVRLALDLIYTAILCFGIRAIAKETGERKIVYRSVRNFVFYCVFFALQGVVLIASWTKWAPLAVFVTSTALSIWTLIIKLVCLIFNCVMLVSCYSKICDADDVDMMPKPSRFKKHKEEKDSIDIPDVDAQDKN